MKHVTLKDLSHLLRHKEEWPEGFVWDYTNRETCAAGLADKKYGLNLRSIDPDDERHFPYWDDLRSAFDINWSVQDLIFNGAARDKPYGKRDVTPETVADIIDQLIG